MSSNFQIQIVNTDAQRKAFIDFPQKVYKNDPYWVEPLRRNTIKELAHNSPFRVYGQLQQFIAVYEFSGETLGRIVAAINQRLFEKEGEAPNTEKQLSINLRQLSHVRYYNGSRCGSAWALSGDELPITVCTVSPSQPFQNNNRRQIQCTRCLRFTNHIICTRRT